LLWNPHQLRSHLNMWYIEIPNLISIISTEKVGLFRISIWKNPGFFSSSSSSSCFFSFLCLLSVSVSSHTTWIKLSFSRWSIYMYIHQLQPEAWYIKKASFFLKPPQSQPSKSLLFFLDSESSWIGDPLMGEESPWKFVLKVGPLILLGTEYRNFSHQCDVAPDFVIEIGWLAVWSCCCPDDPDIFHKEFP